MMMLLLLTDESASKRGRPGRQRISSGAAYHRHRQPPLFVWMSMEEAWSVKRHALHSDDQATPPAGASVCPGCRLTKFLVPCPGVPVHTRPHTRKEPTSNVRRRRSCLRTIKSASSPMHRGQPHFAVCWPLFSRRHALLGIERDEGMNGMNRLRGATLVSVAKRQVRKPRCPSAFLLSKMHASHLRDLRTPNSEMHGGFVFKAPGWRPKDAALGPARKPRPLCQPPVQLKSHRTSEGSAKSSTSRRRPPAHVCVIIEKAKEEKPMAES